MKKQNNKDIKLWAYLIGYGIALAFLLLPYAVGASNDEPRFKNNRGFNYKKHYKKSAKNKKKSLRNFHWTGEGCGINK
jgi:hypothetical protein